MRTESHMGGDNFAWGGGSDPVVRHVQNSGMLFF